MGQEGIGQGARGGDPVQTKMQFAAGLPEIRRAKIGQFLSLDVGQEQFDWIQIGSVGRQRCHGQPVTLAMQVRLPQLALVPDGRKVRIKAVPSPQKVISGMRFRDG